MLKSLLKRFAYACTLLGIISIIAFYLGKLVPGDEILDYLSIDESGYSSRSNPLEQRTAYSRVAEKRGLNLPYFYFSIRPGFYPDSLYSIVPVEDRNTIMAWVQTTHNHPGAMQLYRDCIQSLHLSCTKADTSAVADKICLSVSSVINAKDLFTAHHQLIRLQQDISQLNADQSFTAQVQKLNEDLDILVKSPKKLTSLEWLPSFDWHGTSNQYHKWITGFLSFKPLTSLIDGRNAWTKIIDALKWTLLLNGFAFVLAIVLGILIGLWSGTHDGTWMERLINIKLFALFALPSFWLATLLIYFFSSGEWLSVFPSGGLGSYNATNNLFEKSGILISHLFLPVLCLALGSLAYVSRQMKQSVMHQFRQPYVLSLRTQGISEKTILRKHVFRNALFPMITMIGGALPALLSGSLIIEVIFSIPGMGRLMYNSLLARDWPVVFPILMFAATITVFAYILTDVIYKWADPRTKTMES
ncbi:MAG TPA: ABC transporter permease [Saprospiraceae bacterium]